MDRAEKSEGAGSGSGSGSGAGGPSGQRDPVPPHLWGRDHFSTLAYAFCSAGRPLDRQRLRTLPGCELYPTRLQGGLELSEHDDLDCLRDAEAAGVLTNEGTGMRYVPKFTAQGLVLGQWLVHAMERRLVSSGSASWSEVLQASGALLCDHHSLQTAFCPACGEEISCSGAGSAEAGDGS